MARYPRPCKVIVTLVLAVLVLTTGCGPAAPTVTPAPPTDTPVPPTATAITIEQESTAAPTEAAPAPTAAPTTRPGYFSREQLIEDVRQLAYALETGHPDPYSYGGGKIAFHRRLQRLLNAIPADGMTRDEFLRLLRPFVAAVGDSHTEIWSNYSVSVSRPGGIPVRFGIVEDDLYVAGVLRAEDQRLIGSILVSVEGVPVSELLARQRDLAPLENTYHELEEMASHTLWYGPKLQDVLPEWENEGQIAVTLQQPTGEIEAITFSLPVAAHPTYWAETACDLPSAPHHGFSYTMLDPLGSGEEIAYLRVDHMEGYRERDELRGQASSHTPSATEEFKRMVVEMEENGTETLIVDLRDNGGGTSYMADILVFFLYGKNMLRNVIAHAPLTGGGMIKRYSAFYFESYGNTSISFDEINEGRTVPLQLGDYDFSRFFGGRTEEFRQLTQLERMEYTDERHYAKMPTFYAEYESGEYAGYYRPKNVVVLVSPWTFSSGLTMARHLYLAGATLVGTPSSQASNSFCNAGKWVLKNTRIEGQMSTMYYAEFPIDSELAHTLPVHYALTYEKLASYGFDPNAEFLYALELLPELGETTHAPIAIAPEQAPGTRPAEATAGPTTAPETKPGNFSRDDLIEDVRQLAHILESAHPDPYINGGGIIAFHHRLQRLLNAIPEEGMTRDEFIRLLRPFVAAVGDSHTEIWSDYRVNDYAPGGVPLRFGTVEQSLYVAGVPQGVDRDLIGATLVSVEGMPLADLCERQKGLVALENEYHVLEELASRALWYEPYLQDLLPEWADTGEISVDLQLPSGEVQEVVFTLPKGIDFIFTPESQVTLPSTDDSGFLYEFLDGEGKIAYLRVQHMSYYREAREMETGRPAPHLHSATETFRSMVVEMEEAGTDVLIVDLRGNQGGHSVMGDILTYFLYGKEALRDIMTHADSTGGGMVRKYSDLFWERTQSWTSLEQVNEGRALPLRADDYDFAGFSGDVEWSLERKADSIAHSEKVWLALSPTFWEEYQSEAYSSYYCPENVLVLIDSRTFSSGFTMARYLYLAGATFVGTPSSQAANSFGNGQMWHLDHTGLEGTVSTTYSVMFPDDSELARVLPVHYPLTYERLASYGFDPNAEYLYALELLSEQGE